MYFNKIRGLIIVFFIPVFCFAQKVPVVGGGTSTKLGSKTDSVQYVLGAYIGQYIVNNGFTISNQALFKKGIDDVVQGKPMLVHPDSVKSLITHYQSLSAEEVGRKQEKALFESLKNQAGVGMLPSGVYYSIVKAGTGKRPQLTDSVVIHLKGFLADGRLFEDTYPENKPYKTSPNGVILGMKDILQIMPVGSLWRIYLPSALAFGDAGVAGLIPPYSALIYEVELLSIE